MKPRDIWRMSETTKIIAKGMVEGIRETDFVFITKTMAKKEKSVVVLGEIIDQKNFPKLYEWAKTNPEWLETTLKSIASGTGGSITSAIINLESDLQHG